MASTAPPSRSAHRSTAAAERVVPQSAGQLGGPGVGDQRHHLVVGGQPGPGDARGHHRRVAQHRRARGQRGVGPGDDVVAEGDVLGDVDLPAGVDQPHHDARDVLGEPRQVRLGADRRERLPVDLGGVADVVEHPLTLRVRCTQPVSVSGRHQHLTGGRAAARPLAADEVPVPVGGLVERRRGVRRERRRPSARSRGCPCTR